MLAGWIDIFGYAASGLTLATFAQRTMLPMRILAIGANVCFIGYGAMGMYLPVLALHLVLLPINLARLCTLIGPSGDRMESAQQSLIDDSPLPGASSGLL
ncbi:hypothetical protein [Microvirga aerophila]|uniref:Uncharacterized protein n=1 Tax=Microvirga aerophila TaxID=670291 RepID=A0A512BT95_9HYPH|nr:hypothetical protein [Microvirga aerophila]GEO15150.1 hypothetical protein MAE02_28460 [Microvirga aerophila]